MSTWFLVVMSVMQFHVDSFVYDGKLHTFTYKVGASSYVCKDTQVSSFNSTPGAVTLQGQCPADRIHYSGFQK
jgi:hypothetical protein